MKTPLTSSNPPTNSAADFPDADALAALRAWYAGLSTTDAVARYLPGRVGNGRSARGVLGEIRRKLVATARRAHREDLAALLSHPSANRARHAQAVAQAIDFLRHAKPATPSISDDVERWFEARAVRALHTEGITTLADLMVRVQRRRQWWKSVPGLGSISARQIDAFFTSHPDLTERARAVITSENRGSIVPWESLRLPHEVDGSEGALRAPVATCTLDASNDYGRSDVALFARISCNATHLSQGSGTVNSVGNSGARSRVIVTDHGRRHCLQSFPAQTHATGTLGRAAPPKKLA